MQTHSINDIRRSHKLRTLTRHNEDIIKREPSIHDDVGWESEDAVDTNGVSEEELEEGEVRVDMTVNPGDNSKEEEAEPPKKRKAKTKTKSRTRLKRTARKSGRPNKVQESEEEKEDVFNEVNGESCLEPNDDDNAEPEQFLNENDGSLRSTVPLPSDLTQERLEPSLKKNKRYQCDLCDKDFRHVKFLKLHKKTQHDEGTLDRTLDPLVSPYVDPHDQIFECDICGTRLYSKKTFYTHKSRHKQTLREFGSENPSHECDTCHKFFWTEEKLENHREIHELVRPYSCSVCRSWFSNEMRLRRHLLQHAPDRPGQPLKGVKPKPKKFECGECGKIFSKRSSLKDHAFQHSQGDPRPFMCNICGQSYKTPNYLYRHKKTHSALKRFHCKLCNKSFTMSKLLKQHMNVHSERRFECDICMKKFQSKGNMNAHRKKVHADGERINHNQRIPKKKSISPNTLERQLLELAKEHRPYSYNNY